MVRFIPLAMIAGLAVSGCVTVPPEPEPHLTRIARGPCFGFCPVYELGVGPGDAVRFTGLRHTAFVGMKEKAAPAGAISRVDQALAAYRPAAGIHDFECREAITDQATYVVEWRAANGQAMTLNFNSGCRTPEAQALKATLESAVTEFGFDAEAAQTTRPGASRG